MTRPQQFCFAVQLYRDEVNNGGHRRYCNSDDSDLYATAVGVAHDGCAKQGGGSICHRPCLRPPAARGYGNETAEQMEDFGPIQNRIFETADKAFYHPEDTPGERIDVLEALYALQHRAD